MMTKIKQFLIDGWKLDLEEASEEDLPNDDGVCLHEQSIIKVREVLSKQVKDQIEIHEMLHAIFHLRGLDLWVYLLAHKLGISEYRNEIEECIIQQLVSIIYSLVNENPEFFKNLS